MTLDELDLLLCSIFLILLGLEMGGEEELLENEIDQLFILDDTICHRSFGCLNNLLSQSDQTNKLTLFRSCKFRYGKLINLLIFSFSFFRLRVRTLVLDDLVNDLREELSGIVAADR